MDCHSHETVWPWYASVAPGKFLMAKHVQDGRSELNFSTWGEYTPRRQGRKFEEIAELVEGGSMPERSYTWLPRRDRRRPLLQGGDSLRSARTSVVPGSHPRTWKMRERVALAPRSRSVTVTVRR